MNRMRILGALCAGLVASSLGAIAACGGSDAKDSELSTAQAISGATVSIALFDDSGVQVGSGAGVLVSPRLVLTSGHLVAGKYKWVVTSVDGKQKASATRGLTYDWRAYDSNKAHPRRHDVGVIHLDESIKLSAYPKLVAEATADGTKATRVRGASLGLESIDATLTKVRSSPNAWLVDGASNETLITGGAVYDARGILGVVSGRGLTTGKLYVARVDRLVKWLAPKIACSSATGVRTYAEPETDKSKEICEDAGADGSGSSSGNPNGEAAPSTPSNSCDSNNDGICNGNCSSAPVADADSSSNADGSSGDSDGDGSGGGGGGDGSAGGGGGSPSGGTSNGDQASSPPSSGSGGGGGSGSGTTGTIPNGRINWGTWPKPGDGVSDSNEACQGPEDNPDVCPPEPSDCATASCGGGAPDDTVDYGDCACGSKKKSGGVRVN